MAIVYPHIFQDGVGEAASGVQLNENFDVVKVALEAEEAARLALAGKVPGKIARGSSIGTLGGDVGNGGVGGVAITHSLGVKPAALTPVLEEGGSIAAGIFLGVVTGLTSAGCSVQFVNLTGGTVGVGSTLKIGWIAVA